MVHNKRLLRNTKLRKPLPNLYWWTENEFSWEKGDFCKKKKRRTSTFLPNYLEQRKDCTFVSLHHFTPSIKRGWDAQKIQLACTKFSQREGTTQTPIRQKIRKQNWKSGKYTSMRLLKVFYLKAPVVSSHRYMKVLFPYLAYQS